MSELAGAEVKIGQRVFIVPRMTFGAWEWFAETPAESTPAYVLKSLRVMLKKNYPDLTTSDLSSLLEDMPNDEVMALVGEVARAAAAGSEVTAGEAVSP